MGLFGKKKSPGANEADLKEIEASVRLARSRMSEMKMPLGDLFAMMGEDERPILAAIPIDKGFEPDRVLPGQISKPGDEKKPTRVDRSLGDHSNRHFH